MTSISEQAIHRRPVTFGNPALGTYGGCVYTLESSDECQEKPPSGLRLPSDVDATRVSRCVALIDVPPEQCPEGILTFARSHRQFVEHVRILIASAPSEQVQQGDSESSPGDTVSNSVETSRHLDENAAAEAHSRTYIILFQLSSEKAVDVFVKNLHGKPYTSLDETQVASVFPVVAVHGDDGVDLMHPFFAARIGRRPALSIDSTGSALNEGNLTEIRSPSSSNDESTSIRAASPQHIVTKGHNCAVCLEDMNVGKTSLLTTVCNHSFHLDCLLQWQDSPCPVCRYDHSGLNEALSQSHVCGTTENNHVCLICGVVSCGGARHARRSSSETFSGEDAASLEVECRRVIRQLPTIQSHRGGETSDQLSSQPPSRQPMSHAKQHYDETLHAYALDTETQHVCDFCGQGYVHRLLQNAKDGKLVEVNDPNSKHITGTNSQSWAQRCPRRGGGPSEARGVC